ncbi:MAG: four-helix bundle copper-binding protein [Gammaproteobacteria bacterium]|jgi:Cys-rich four helix bundle protein (predicted Tat secretion target)
MPEIDSKPQQIKQKENGISRREILLAMGTAATATYVGSATAAMPGHNHSKHTTRYPDVLDAANTCLDKGQRCIAHCLVSFVEGDTTLAKCASKVHEMQAICGAFSYLLAANSVYSKEYAGICSAVCEDCAKECREHDEHHECRECAEACEAIVKAIGKSFA